ncbi:tetratricopeptide repeat protein [Sphingobacterium sp. E70]|uniref:tetratricopeptide repeat protein n=1 Tax=Sphingobacterium sp. E70 TaxID=2853439 RepID=UPI00211B7A62|nr:tetratricopeptide repeat protein [Sphingobacterium sp. E70]ULT22486.1 tetratricopeptide repeat protein [Sphingobacterium sp. E70]
MLKKLELTSEYKSNYGFAINNLMVSYYQIGDYKEALNYTNAVKNYEKSSEEEIANAFLYAGKCYIKQNKKTEAMKEFSLAALKSRTVFGAEAKYNVAVIQLENKQYDACIKTAMDLSDNFSSYEYWVAKALSQWQMPMLVKAMHSKRKQHLNQLWIITMRKMIFCLRQKSV